MSNEGKSRIKEYTQVGCSRRMKDYNVINNKRREVSILTPIGDGERLNNVVLEALRRILLQISHVIIKNKPNVINTIG